MGGAALRPAIEAELGYGGPRRPRQPGALVEPESRGRLAPREPATCAPADARAAAEPLLSEQSPLPQSSLSPRRSRTRRRPAGPRARATGQGRPPAEWRETDRARRHLSTQDARAGQDLRPLRPQRGLR